MAGCTPQSHAQSVSLERDGQKVSDFASIQSALDAAKPGDVIRLSPGTYRERLRLEKSGTPQKPIVLEGGGAVLDGAAAQIAWENHAPRVWRALVAWSGDAKLAKSAWCSLPTQLLWAYSTRAEFDLGKNGAGTFRQADGTVWLRLENDENPNDLAVKVPTGESGLHFGGNASNLVVRDLKIENAGVYGVRLQGEGVQGVKIENVSVGNTFSGVSTGSIWDEKGFGSRIRIENCRVHNDWNDNWIWSYFYEAEPGNRADAGAMRGAGIEVHASDSVVKGCTVDGQHDGMAVSGPHLEISGNTIRRIHDDALEIEGRVQNGFAGAVQMRVFDNWLENCYVGVSLGSLEPGPVWIYRNTIINDRAVIFKEGAAPSVNTAFKTGKHPWGQSVGWRIYHNTVYTRGGQLNADWVGSGNNDLRDVVWLNNIFYAQNGTFGRRTGLAKNGVFFDGNLYFSPVNGRPFWNDWNGLGAQNTLQTARLAFADWEQHGVWANPLFREIGASEREGWHLQSQSPARDAGVNLPKNWPDLPVVKDGKPDIGAHEFNAPAPNL